MELPRPDLSGMAIRNISGLGPVKSDISISQYGSTDGGFYQSSRMPSRDITIDLVFFGIDIEKIRHKTYRYFPIKRKITLTVETETKTVDIDGFVESNEPNIFSSTESTIISVRCPDPYFRLSNEVVSEENLGAKSPRFEFPFSNESLTLPLLEFGDIQSYMEKNIFYDGDAPNGVKITVDFFGPVVNPKVYIRNTTQSLGVNTAYIRTITGSDVQGGDTLVIDTRRGEKSALLFRGDFVYNVVGALTPGSKWLTVDVGDNVFTYTASSGKENLRMTVTTNTLYTGV